MPLEPGNAIADEARTRVLQGWRHLKLQRPLAAWACWREALRRQPEHPAATEALARLDTSSHLPRAARVERRFAAPDREDRRGRWDAEFRSRPLANLEAAAEAFERLVASDPLDAPARYNHGLCLAWLGRNEEAIRALDGYVALAATGDPEPAAEAWALAEILRHGAGAEHLADDLSASVRIPWPDADRDVRGLDAAGRIVPRTRPFAGAMDRDAESESTIMVHEWLDRAMPSPWELRCSDDLPICLATILQGPDTLVISTPRPRNGPLIEARLRDAGFDTNAFDWSLTPLPLAFLDAALWAFRFPPDTPDDARERLTREAIERYFEEEWVRLPRIGLARNASGEHQARSPLEAGRHAAAGDDQARVKLEGVIRLRVQLASREHMANLSSGYPFDRLRRRLGLPPGDPESVDPADLSCAGEAELELLDPGKLDRFARIEAARSSLALGRENLAARFTHALEDGSTHRPPPDQNDEKAP